MNKTLYKRSKLLHQLRSYFKAHKDKLYILTPKQRAFLEIWAFPHPKDVPAVWPSNLATELTKCAMLIRRENKKIWTLQNKCNYIEGMSIHETHPKLYNLCLKLRIWTLSDLDLFINAARSGSIPAKQLMRQYPLIIDLIDYYDEHRTSFRTNKGI